MSRAKTPRRKGSRKENAAELLCVFLCAFASLREKLSFAVGVMIAAAVICNAQNREYLEFDTPDFKLKLLKESQTVAALEPKSAAGFDFTPGDRLKHHLGDLTLRIRVGTSGPWQKYDTAESRRPVKSLASTGTTLTAADLSPTLPVDIPLEITRSWIFDEKGRLVLTRGLDPRTH